jgi:hypothetical protein
MFKKKCKKIINTRERWRRGASLERGWGWGGARVAGWSFSKVNVDFLKSI